MFMPDTQAEDFGGGNHPSASRPVELLLSDPALAIMPAQAGEAGQETTP